MGVSEIWVGGKGGSVLFYSFCWVEVRERWGVMADGREKGGMGRVVERHGVVREGGRRGWSGGD